MFAILIALVSLPAGVPVGAICSRGLNDAVHFAGWIPTVVAGVTSVLLVILGTALTGLVIPANHDYYGAMIPVMGSTGAAAAAVKHTWADT